MMSSVTDDRLTIRRAVGTDDAALLAIDLSAWTAESGFPSFTTGEREEFFSDRSGPDAHLIAEYDGEVVGYIRLQDKYPFLEGAGVLAVNGLAVSPGARRLGIGSALLDAATAEGKRRGARKITLSVFATNTAAQRLYQRHGYIVESRRTAEFLIDGRYVDDLGMAKFL
jgi:ribosomal protein S18 acetylase RimI-like enzyme